MKTKPIRVSEEHVHELWLLKKAWKKRSIDEVIEELIKPRRIEKIGALGIEEKE